MGPTPPPFKSPYGPPGVPVDTRKLIHFATDGVQPPSTVYLDVNDSFFIQLNTIEAAVTFTLRYRILEPSGEIIQGQHDMVQVSAQRNFNTYQFAVTEGFLLSLELGENGGVQPRGGCHGRVFILRGGSAGLFLTQALTQGYIDTFTHLSWPPGIQEPAMSGQGNSRSITGTTPAAGAEISETVPNLTRWKVKAFRFQLTTSATVATRGVTLSLDDGVNSLFQIEAPSTQAAGLVQQYNYGNIGARADKVFGTNIAVPLPADLILQNTWRIRTITTALQVGDQYTAPQYCVEEWLGG